MQVARANRAQLTAEVLDVLMGVGRRFRRRSAGATIDPGAFWLLKSLQGDGPVRPTDVAAVLGLDISTVSRHLAQLSRAGLVERSADPDDRRAQRVQLSPAGRAEVEAALAARRGLLERSLSDWTDDDVEHLHRLITRMLASLESTGEDRTTVTAEPTNQGPRTAVDPPAPGYLSRQQILVVLGGLMAGMFLAALDQSIVGVALPKITSDLGGLDKLSWVVTAYLLTSTAATPLWGKISDLYGRRPMFQSAIVVFLLGSVICGFAGPIADALNVAGIDLMIAGRAVQGLGGGGLMSLALAVIGDIIPPRERGRYQGLFGAVFGVSSVAGPLLGGLFTDQLGWEWIFFINIPIGAAALVVTSIALKLHHVRREARVDYLGAAMIVGAVTSLVLYLSWAGPDLGWTSTTGVALLVAIVVLTILFVLVERRAAEPIIPIELFGQWTFTSNVAFAMIMGVGMFGGLIYLPIYLQAVKGYSATQSGLAMLPLVVGIFATSISSGQIMSRTGRYKWMPITGSIVVGAALFALSRLEVDTGYGALAAIMVAFGAGLGFTMQVVVTAVQNTVDRRHMGTATAAVTFFRSMGGAVGTALFGAILNTRLAHHLTEVVPAAAQGQLGSAAAGANDISALRSLPEPVKTWVLTAFTRAMDDVFLVGVPFMVVALVIAVFMTERPLAGREPAEAPQRSADPAGLAPVAGP